MKINTGFSQVNAKANTSDIQEAINRLSYTTDRTLVLPAGLILVDRLFFYYDPVLNPGFNQNTRQGLINIIGQGTTDISYSLNKKYQTGTILRSIYTGSESCFSSGNDSHNSAPYKSRHVKFRDITLVGNNIGFVLEACNPEFEFSSVKILQENAAGSGLKIGAFWFSSLEKTYIINSSQEVKTGVGMLCSSGTSGGLLNFDRSLIDSFHTGLLYEGQNYFSNFNITQSAIQHCTIGFKNTTRIILLGLERVHFEDCIKEIQSDAEIDTLRIDSYYSTGRNGLSSANIFINSGVRILDARNISLRDGQADVIELKRNISSVDNFINIYGVNYFHDTPGTIIKPIITITNNGSGLCRVKINTHNYISGRKVILNGTPYDGEYVISVIDNNYIDLIDSTYFLNSSGGTCALLCHIVKNIDNIQNIKVEAVVYTDYGINFTRTIG